MSELEKALLRLASAPTDFTWPELERIAAAFGLEIRSGGGSGRRIVNPADGAVFHIHRPHPSNILKQYQLRGFLEYLRQEGFL